ncbi:Nucleolar protein 13 [Rhodotorula kratochvilovae]
MGDEQYAFTIPPPADEGPVVARPAVPLTGKYIHPDRRNDASPAPSNKRKAPSHDAPAHRRREANGVATEAQEEEAAPAPAQDDDEERPLSHKEKRLAKKRKLAAEAAGLDPDAPAPAAAPAASSAPATTTIGTTLVGNTPARSAHGIWLGNLNYVTHLRELLQWFAGKGLKDVVRINMPGGKRSHENNRGFAYLDFPTAEDQAAAVALSEQHLDGRKLLIKASSDYTGRPAPAPVAGGTGGGVKDVLASLDPSALEQPDPRAAPPAGGAAGDGTGAGAPPPTLNRTARKILSRQKNPAGPTLFLGNLGFETKVDDIREMFDRNQVRSMEWAPKEKGVKGKKGAKGKGKGKAEVGEEDEESGDEEKEDADTDRDDDSDDSDDESDEESEDGDAEKGDAEEKKAKGKGKKEKKDKGPKDLAQAKDAGIRKIRLGTFEDTGKCKGWAFVDFHLAAQATRALLNLHNHQLNGRKLNVEYASAEAVRRGQLGSRAVSKAHGRQRREAPGANGEDGEERSGGRNGRKRGEREWDDGDVKAFAAEAAAGAYNDAPPPRRRERRDGGERRGREPQALPGGKRAKPGAALAMAQRASEAIVASTGRKTTFD